MLHVAARLEKSHEAAQPYFDQAVAADPDHVEAYEWMFDLLKYKWAADSEKMFKFARDAVATHPNDPRFGLLIAYAHMEEGIFFQQKEFEYFSDPNIWGEVKESLIKFIQAYPNSSQGHNDLAHFAYLAQDYPLARQEFDTIGDGWVSWVWLGRRNYFEEVRKRVYRNTGSLRYTLYNSPRDLALSIAFISILALLIWRTMIRKKTMYDCPQCGKPIMSAWKKFNFGCGRTIICPACKVCIGVSAKSSYILYFVTIVPLIFGTQLIKPFNYNFAHILMVLSVIMILYGYVNIKLVPLVVRDQAATRKIVRRITIAGLVGLLALLVYFLTRYY